MGKGMGQDERRKGPMWGNGGKGPGQGGKGGGYPGQCYGCGKICHKAVECMANVDLVDDGQDDEDNKDQEVGGVWMVGGVEKVNAEAWAGGPPGLGGGGPAPAGK